MKLNRLLIVSSLAGAMSLGLGIGITIGAQLGSSMFSDVPSGTYYDSAVGELATAGIFKTNSEGRFRPGDPVNRAEMAVIIKRLRDELNGIDITQGATSSRRSSSSKSSSSSSSSNSSSSSSSVTSIAPNGMFRFTSKAYTADEDDGTVSVSIVRTNSNKGNVTVEYELIAGTATADSDYQIISGTLNFADKETSKTVDVKILQDTTMESNETFTMKLSNPTNNSGLGDPSEATITLRDDDGGSTSSVGGTTSSIPAAGMIQFAAVEYSQYESKTTATITLERVGGSQGAVAVTYSMADGTATTNNYDRVSGSLTLNSGETEKTFTVNLYNNTDIGGNKTVKLTLAAPTGGAILGTSSATLIIVDDETVTTFGSGSFRMSKNEYEVNESDGKAVVTVQRVGGSAGTVSVKYRTYAGSATTTKDFADTNGTLTFRAGETAKTVTIPLVKDTEFDQGETLSFDLSEPSTGTSLGSPASSNVVIN